MKKVLFLLLLIAPIFLYSQESLEDLVTAGVQLHDEGKFDEAIDIYNKALKIDDNSSLVNYELGYSYYAKGEYKKSLKYLNKVLKNGTEHLKAAYITKGSALDNLKKPKDAIKTYKKALEIFPEEYLLYFNLALTQYQNDKSKEAEENLIQAISLNPTHSTSNYLLSIIKSDQGRKIESLLTNHFFLLMEPNSKRSIDALQLLNNTMNEGVNKRDEMNIDVSLSLSGLEDEFSAANLMLSLMSASNMTKDNKDKTEQELFMENTETLFTILKEQKEKEEKKGIWWEIYVNFFSDLIDSGNLEAYCYYITQSKSEVEQKWIKEHEEEMNKFYKWIQG